MLGPVRFTHITNCAVEAIRKYHQSQSGTETREGNKVVKLDNKEIGEETLKLTKELESRDENISILRKYLAELKGLEASGEGRKMEYERLSLDTLKKLDKARDSTVAWLLREIEKVEGEKKDEVVKDAE